MLDFQKRFLDLLIPLAMKYAQPSLADRLILPSLTIAQGIVESDWGRSILATQGHNYFGIKANAEWIGPRINKLTGEVYNNQPTKIYADFRSYPNPEAGVKDHRLFLLRSHYNKVWDQNVANIAIEEVNKAGYATAPSYTVTLLKRVSDYDLTQYDKEFLAMPKVFLSPSSQEWNRYATTHHNTEEAVCNKIADLVEAILKEHGFLVMQNDPSGSPSDHTRKSNAYGPDLHVPIHTNAGGGRGCEIFVYNPDNPNSRNTKAAKAIYKYVSALTPTADRGIRKNTSFYEIKNTTSPCVYCELQFHDNAEDAQWILNNLYALAEAVAHGICDAFGITFRRTVK